MNNPNISSLPTSGEGARPVALGEAAGRAARNLVNDKRAQRSHENGHLSSVRCVACNIQSAGNREMSELRSALDMLPDRTQRLFEVLVDSALKGERCPPLTILDEEHKISRNTCERSFAALVGAGLISVEWLNGKFRQISILMGPYRGAKTAGFRRLDPNAQMVIRPRRGMVDHRAVKPTFRPEDLVAKSDPLCEWCGEPFKHNPSCTAACCSDHCSHELKLHAYASKAKVEARRARLAEPKPKGCATIEEWLAAGGTVYREPGFTSLRAAA